MGYLEYSFVGILCLLLFILLKLIVSRVKEHHFYTALEDTSFLAQLGAVFLNWKLPGKQRDYDKVVTTYLNLLQNTSYHQLNFDAEFYLMLLRLSFGIADSEKSEQVFLPDHSHKKIYRLLYLAVAGFIVYRWLIVK